MRRSNASAWISGTVGWALALLLFFPVFWLVITAFKTEQDAYATTLRFTPTLASFHEVFARGDYGAAAWNSILISLGSTLFCFVLAIPAAYQMAFFPTRRTPSMLMWMLSTRMMPAAGVLIPVYLLCRSSRLLGNPLGLIIVYTLMNLPIAVWMCHAYFVEVPASILEAARVDGAGIARQIWHVVAPLTLPGIFATALLLIVLAWNESFWSLNLSGARGAPLTAFIASYSNPEGLFWAKLSAASLLAIAPVIVMGWLTQRQLVSGLTFGAVK
ncbi:MAG TPA: carbohydrate ABC transporter permease [Verrucomicrobiae bacterium]|nr:carbohydrate ABC transporter permease [Verrucomicrobiae bacterium]